MKRKILTVLVAAVAAVSLTAQEQKMDAKKTDAKKAPAGGGVAVQDTAFHIVHEESVVNAFEKSAQALLALLKPLIGEAYGPPRQWPGIVVERAGR